MKYNLMMSRYHEESNILLTQKYATAIPLKVILTLLHIEKNDWQIYYEPPYQGLGNYILCHIDDYPILKPYISKSNCRFEFVYEWLIQYAQSVDLSFSKNNVSISLSTYYKETSHSSYKETWTLTNPTGLTHYTFFECDCTSTSSLT
ncbi:MAG: hypothetical protein J6F30_09240 [Cellulosilyticum sp.]|nr:hypothetical protein [Cellulosilyticum sp.]